MADPLMLAGGRAARFARPSAGPIELVGRSAAIARVHELVRRAATSSGGVLLVADPGADVESVAREIHDRRHATAPYIHVVCGAADPAGLDRMLFGDPVAAGDLEAVTADSRIAVACGGTLFLQDVADLPSAVQARLAHIAREGEMRIDGQVTMTNLRLVASASPGIDGEVHSNRFRSDLYRRLVTSRIDLPALGSRSEDVPAIAARLLEDICATRGSAPRTFTQAALALLGALTWPGNLAELHGVVERVVLDAPHDVIQIEDLLPSLNLNRAPVTFAPAGNLREARLRFERDYIAAVLQHHGWRMAEAAETLGIQRPNLYRKARQLGIPVARVSE